MGRRPDNQANYARAICAEMATQQQDLGQVPPDQRGAAFLLYRSVWLAVALHLLREAGAQVPETGVGLSSAELARVARREATRLGTKLGQRGEAARDFLLALGKFEACEDDNRARSEGMFEWVGELTFKAMRLGEAVQAMEFSGLGIVDELERHVSGRRRGGIKAKEGHDERRRGALAIVTGWPDLELRSNEKIGVTLSEIGSLNVTAKAGAQWAAGWRKDGHLPRFQRPKR